MRRLEHRHSSEGVFITRSKAGLECIEQAERAARSREPVLITGETGTGKELIAAKVHNNVGPFTVVDCTHLTKELAESEMFGHVRGAFTGAQADRPGLLETAHSGSAFFDEIGELPLDLQAKLLRAIQEKRFRRVGSNREYYSDFRILAATNRDLKREIASGRFREDLYYRLAVIKIKIPPLRDRPDDVLCLLEHFSRIHGICFNMKATAVLCRYEWPGNVRQMENFIRGLAATSNGHEIDVDQLSATILNLSAAGRQSIGGWSRESRLQSHALLAASAGDSCESTTHTRPLSDLEKSAIIDALIANHGDRTATAAALDIGRSTLYRRLVQMQGDPTYMNLLERILTK